MSKIEKIGEVVSKKTAKTLIVKIKRTLTHPIYKKQYGVSKRYAVHDEQNQYKEGDIVKIQNCRPMSKRKRFIAIEKVGERKLAARFVDEEETKEESEEKEVLPENNNQ